MIAISVYVVGCRLHPPEPASAPSPGSSGGKPTTPGPGNPGGGNAVPADLARSLTVAPVAAACGTPIVDGVLSPGEWDAAVSVRFAAVIPESAGGGVIPATFQAMSDGTNLYLAVRVDADTSRFGQSYFVEMDADLSDSATQGDDIVGFSWGRYGGTRFADDYRWNCNVDGSEAICGPGDDYVGEGFPPPGTTDGGGAIRFDAGSTVVEMWHPYRGPDPLDLQKCPGDVVPLSLAVRLLDPCGVDDFRCIGDYGFPVSGYRDVVLGCGLPPEEDVVAVRIDVKPGDALPTINLSSGGTTAVAVLGSDAFPVADVDLSTVFFAGAPVATLLDGSFQAALEDSDGDGRDDLVAHFETAALMLEVGDVEASLAGKLSDGREFKGTDVVRVKP